MTFGKKSSAFAQSKANPVASRTPNLTAKPLDVRSFRQNTADNAVATDNADVANAYYLVRAGIYALMIPWYMFGAGVIFGILAMLLAVFSLGLLTFVAIPMAIIGPIYGAIRGAQEAAWLNYDSFHGPMPSFARPGTVVAGAVQSPVTNS